MQNEDTTLSAVRTEFEQIVNSVYAHSEAGTHLYEVEKDILKKLLYLGYRLIVLYIGLVKEKFDRPAPGEVHKGQHRRNYLSIFGNISFARAKVHDPVAGKVAYPLDRQLGLNRQKYSFLLQDRVGHSATDKPFGESVELLNKIFGLNLHGSHSERISDALSAYIEDYYALKTPDADQGGYFVAGFDDKGVPIRAGSLDREACSSAVRLGRGQKRDVKRHCTVSVTYSFNPYYRTGEQVLQKLFKEEVPVQNPETEPADLRYNKHVRAFMCSKEKAVAYGFEDVLKRMPGTDKPIVVLIDGDRGLEGAVDKVGKKMGIEALIESKVLDFIHVTEYIWKVANAHLGEKHGGRSSWVREQCGLILKSGTQKVIDTFEAIRDNYQKGQSKHDKIQASITYFKNHIHMMDYAHYLEKGYPISTGAIESACGHFVKNRMERNGMHWTQDGAQDILNLRAANKNKDWDDFIKFYIDNQINQELKMVA